VAEGGPTIKVWDIPVRIGHWLLVAGVAAAWFTGEGTGKWHEYIGYAVLGVVCLRLSWGFSGSKYARFKQFIYSPRHTLKYSQEILHGRHLRYIGHNPLGGWMIAALLSTLIAVCCTGWLYTTDTFWGVEWVEELHEALAILLLVLAALHVAGVVFTSIFEQENLVAAMFHGRKREPGIGDIG
jgi:cytochrome b